jgi:hypothetical protein
MKKHMISVLVLTLVFLTRPVIAQTLPLDQFHGAQANAMYDMRTDVDTSIAHKTGGWQLYCEVYNAPSEVFSQIKKITFKNIDNGLTVVFDQKTIDDYVWLGTHVVGAYLWLGHDDLNVAGKWRVILEDALGQKYKQIIQLQDEQLHVPMPPVIQILHMEPSDGGTLMTFKAPFPTNWNGPMSVRMRLFGDADADGKHDDAIDEFRDECDGASDHFCFNPENDTVSFFVPYSGIRGRLEFRYHDTPIGTSRTVVYFTLP